MYEGTGDRDAPPQTQAFVLRVTAGVHRGAVIRVGRAGIVVIGAGDDCDVILADAAVARHHCILQKREGEFLLRAIDGTMTVDGHPHDPGTVIAIRVGAAVVIGSASLEIVAPSSPVQPFAPAAVAATATTVRPFSPVAATATTIRPSALAVRLAGIASDTLDEVPAKADPLSQLLQQSGLSVWLVAAAAVSIILAAVLLTVEIRQRAAQAAVLEPDASYSDEPVASR